MVRSWWAGHVRIAFSTKCELVMFLTIMIPLSAPWRSALSPGPTTIQVPFEFANPTFAMHDWMITRSRFSARPKLSMIADSQSTWSFTRQLERSPPKSLLLFLRTPTTAKFPSRLSADQVRSVNARWWSVQRTVYRRVDSEARQLCPSRIS